MVESELWGVILFQTSGIADFSSTKRPRDLLGERLLVAKLSEQWLMKEILDVFRVVESSIRRRGLGSLLLVTRLTGIDT